MPDLPTTAPWDASGSQSRVNVFGPGIVGLLIQGIGTGMVFSQLATWLSLPRRTEHRFITVLTVFITTIGFVQTAVYFLSIWRIYVEHYGEPSVWTWTERVHLILTVLISTPVQLLLIWRCYHVRFPSVPRFLMTYTDQILNRNAYLIIPLLLLLLGSVALAIFDTLDLFLTRFGEGIPGRPLVMWTFLLYSASSSILDIILSSILFYYLTQSRKRIYVDHTVQWISRHIVVVWQSVIPPTVCTLGISILYGVTHHLYPGPGLMWYPTLQAVIGKLYVLSYFYTINSRTQLVSEQEQPSTYISALTVPALHGMSTTHNVLEGHPLELYSNFSDRTDESQKVIMAGD
ncbi:hypothetical protein EDB92DRAFT_2017365 [Lactarius akahatsu]|uniref:DUF6534 domain-containing protein n=1 Tax=Lactarius akahatsu TaxID=416441 RepID=A0AAD4LMG0_9AGAM|nr:hypothetical protein EDB92DRAFT_2017365 [Lactarius akahatsu]